MLSEYGADKRVKTALPIGKLIPNLSKKPCIWLILFVRSLTSDSRTRCRADSACCDSVFGVNNRMAGRDTTSQIAAASTKSFLLPS
ncbi:MAG: hypothetical protein E5299_01178 [Burkholderia gladioli]|nr:MAG: hypothetical protein E5299_01178 [Burkholderia gladioli]